MAHLSIYLLGSFRVTLDGQPVTGFVSDKARALLAYLVVEADRLHRRERLTGLLWPDSSEQGARASLRTTLSNLRKVIGDREADPPFLHVSRPQIGFNTASDFWCDVHEFLTLSAGRREAQSVPQLEKAVALYQGDFLQDLSLPDSSSFEDWVVLMGEHLRRLLQEDLHQLVRQHEERGQVDRALQYARRLVELEPEMESRHRMLIRLLALSGQRKAALTQYQVLVQMLKREFGARPGEQTQALYRQIQRGELRPLPPPTPSARVVNAAVRPDVRPFFRDRQDAIAWLHARLADPQTRLVAVIGRGGYGKTALVSYVTVQAETGSLSLDDLDLAIWGVAYFHPRYTGLTLGRLYADLGRILGQPTASILDNRWQDPEIPVEQKAYFLLEQILHTVPQDRLLLIILDSLEGALDDGGRLGDEGLSLWLKACLTSGGPVRLIVTSRQEWQLPDGAMPYVRQWDLDHGLPEADGIAMLHALDPEGRCRLRNAAKSLLRRAIRRTDGVPFSLEKIAGLLRKDRRLTLNRLLADESLFAREVTLALADRGFSHLSGDEQRVMEALAVHERPASARAIAFILATEDMAAVQAVLEELARSYFVVHRDDGTWGLHEVDAQAVYLRLEPERRAALHRRVGELYERPGTGQDILAAAQHFYRAGDHGRAADLVTDHAEAINNRGQATELRQLLGRFTPQQLDRARWAAVHIARGGNYELIFRSFCGHYGGIGSIDRARSS